MEVGAPLALKRLHQDTAPKSKCLNKLFGNPKMLKNFSTGFRTRLLNDVWFQVPPSVSWDRNLRDRKNRVQKILDENSSSTSLNQIAHLTYIPVEEQRLVHRPHKT
jgi:hypothetical protein